MELWREIEVGLHRQESSEVRVLVEPLGVQAFLLPCGAARPRTAVQQSFGGLSRTTRSAHLSGCAALISGQPSGFLGKRR